MRGVRLMLVALMSLSIGACSLFSGGKGTSGDDTLGGAGEGNIPLANPGSELADVNFAFDSAVIEQTAQGILKKNAQWLNDNPSQKVVVEGHCDERGTNEYNLALGERRAQSVYDFLKKLGVQENRLSTISYGEELPLDPGHTESAWAKNRRAHFAFRN